MKTVPLDRVNQCIKKSVAVSLSSLLFVAAGASFAQNNDITDMQQELDNISIYLQNLGMYYGYDLTNFCPSTNGNCPGSSSGGSSGSGPVVGSTPFNNELTNATSTFGAEVDLITSFLGSILLPTAPSNAAAAGATAAATQANPQLVPSATAFPVSPYAAIIDTYQNQSFATVQTLAYPGPNPGSFSVSPLIDQVPYQADPVNQSILNILSTPDVSYCINSTTGAPTLPCNTGATVGADGTLQNNPNLGGGPVLSQVQIMLNTIGAFPPVGSSTSASNANVGSVYPATGFYVLPSQNASLLTQLNSDSLLGPLIFDNTGTTSNNGGSTPPASGNQGLSATNQIEQAANYIRYASGAVAPLTQPNSSQYGTLYAQAVNAAGNVTPADQLSAQSIIASYLTNLRVYAAQTSVGISNLYSILSKRMPQNSLVGTNQKTSPALSEYLMATWRLQPPASSTTQTWTAQINTASSATVEKEIAILLAEINYQLYLGRVQQERSLLTETTMLLQASKNVQPDARLAKTPGAELPGTSIPSS